MRRGLRPKAEIVEDPHGKLIVRKGYEHEAACLAGLRERCGDFVGFLPPHGRHGRSDR